MKCEYCGKNEVDVLYRSSVNGHVTTRRLCSECAARLGYLPDSRSRQLIEELQSDIQDLWGSGLLDSEFFGLGFQLLGGHLFGEELFDDFFSDMPSISSPDRNAQTESERPAEREEPLFDPEAQVRFSKMRQRNAWEAELRQAIRDENFERAAELRDQLRAAE